MMESTSKEPRTPEKIIVEAVKSDWLGDWDEYVGTHADATFFHLSGWSRVIRDSFGHTPHYLQAADATGAIRGILPLFEIRSFLFGHFLVSLPFAVYGGAVADTPQIGKALENEAAALAKELKVDYVELRNRRKTRDDWPTKSLHATFLRQLESDDESILLSIKNKQRAVIRKSLQNNLVRELQEHTRDFFHAYSLSVRNLGTPVFSRRYFDNLKKEFGSACEIVSIKSGDELHCSLISFYFKDQVLPFYGGGLPVSRNSKAMDFMYYDLMCRAARAGYRTFDFGRSKIDSGPYNYKRHWGFTPEPLQYQYYLVESDGLPELSTSNPKYALMIAAWKKLPLRLSQLLGPMVSKYLG